MTAQVLTTELSNLIQDSKRKNPSLRNAAEKSLSELKALPNTSEAQLAAGLEPRSFGEKQTLDVQLKVLQALPSLLHNYPGSLSGKLLISAFQVCFSLHASKTAVVSNTAAASLQQLLAFSFEQVALYDESSSSGENDLAVSIQNGSVLVSSPAADAYHLLDDICLLSSGKQPSALHGAHMNAVFGLELIETFLVTHIDTISNHEELVYVIQNRLMPLIIQALSDKASFALTVRSMRILRLLTSRLLIALSTELEIAINFVNHSLDPRTSSEWKRAICLEFLCEIYSDPKLTRAIYSQYDEQSEQKNLTGDYLALLVRLAGEKPAVIGLGRQRSETEAQHSLAAEQIGIESGGISGAIATPQVDANLNKAGINSQWSTIRTPCLDLVDKTEPPVLPVTYIYSLVLTCITGFSEGLAKFLLPFTVPTESKTKRRRAVASSEQGTRDSESGDHGGFVNGSTTKQLYAELPPSEGKVPINPLSLVDHEMYHQICTSASIVEQCWPALLAASSIFLDASLDSDYLHALIRSVQKFTQVAGMLCLATPRDAFLTTLAKHAVPRLVDDPVNSPVMPVSEHSEAEGDDSREGSESGAVATRHKEVNLSLNPISARNLLCLRALLNLGIALGPVIRESWTIILETLHQVDVALRASSRQSQEGRRTGLIDQSHLPSTSDNEVDTERDAVETAASRLFLSTAALPDPEYLEILKSFSDLAYVSSPGHVRSGLHDKSWNTLSPQATTPGHRRFPSMSRATMNEALIAENTGLILDRMAQIAQCNIQRLSRSQSTNSGWSIFVRLYTDYLVSAAIAPKVRISAAKKLYELANQVISSTRDTPPEHQDETTTRCLDALMAAVSSLWKSNDTKTALSVSLEIHAMGLEALTSILEQRGEVLRSGWATVFSVIMSSFEDIEQAKGVQSEWLPQFAPVKPRSPNLIHFMQRDNEQTGHLLIAAEVAKCTSEKNILGPIHADDYDNTFWSAIWVSLLLHLAQLIGDDRMEVRHSALHTLFGIIDASGDRLDVDAWAMCFRIVFSKLLSVVEVIHRQRRDTAEKADEESDATSVLLVNRLTITSVQAFETLSQHQSFPILWEQLLTHFARLLDHKRLSLSRAIFSSLASIFAASKKWTCLNKLPLNPSWAIWRDNNPSTYDLQGESDNHDALEAYLRYICQFRKLLGREFNVTEAADVMANVRAAVTQSTASRYGSDVDMMTTVQKLGLEVIQLIPRSPWEIVTKLVGEINFLITLAFRAKDGAIVKGKTFVAISKAAMTLLEDVMAEQSRVNDARIAHLLSLSLSTLATPLHLKYRWPHEGKGIPTWRQATSTALSNLDTNLLSKCNGGGQDTQDLWTAIVDISDGIAAADTDNCESMLTVNADQKFDVESFSRLTGTIIPILGNPSIPDRIRRKYVQSVFEHSLIHEPHPDDLARPEQDLLDGLRSQHVGRVQDLPPKARSKMAYCLLDLLFDLVAVHDSSIDCIKLAQAAAPYLILRAGLVLKAYVCDQPLRGLMPQPVSHKREMLHVLSKLVDLDSEPKAFPEAMGTQSEHKKHLFLLFGLVTKALRVARRDEEMSAALRGVLEAMGTGFGF
ncbi:MAG: hypothetical protein Q9219_007524 [cf. Caloplaca sp. 3 TL-2023]